MKLRTAHLWQRGKRWYIVWQNRLGKQLKRSVGNEYRVAEKLCVRVNDWLLDGRDPAVELDRLFARTEAEQVTVHALFQEFMHRHGLRLSHTTQASYKAYFVHISRHGLAAMPALSLTKHGMHVYINKRRSEDVSNATVNRELALLHTVFNKAVEWDMLPHNPIDGVKLLREAEKRVVRLSIEDAEAILSALPIRVARIIEFAIYTGLRKENVLGLLIEQLDFDRRVVRPKVKGGRHKDFPLSDAAVSVAIEAIDGRKSGYVFLNTLGDRYRNINPRFDDVVRKLGIVTEDGSKLRIHDLRHVYGSWLASRGVSLDALRVLMGHSSRSTTDRYVDIASSDLAALPNLLPRIKRHEQKDSQD